MKHGEIERVIEIECDITLTKDEEERLLDSSRFTRLLVTLADGWVLGLENTAASKGPVAHVGDGSHYAESEPLTWLNSNCIVLKAGGYCLTFHLSVE